MLYPDYAAKSPYLVDQLTDYFLGGLDDMAVWTQNVWREAIHMLDKGTESMAVADLDGDGNEDVVIGAPGYRYLKTPQAGAVFVVYGTDEGLPSKDLDLEHSADVSLPGLEYGAVFVYYGVGKRTFSLNMTVQCPKGREHAHRQNCSFSQRDTQSIGQLNVFSTTKGKPLTLDKQFAGSVEFESFGASAAVGKPYPDGSVVLAVAATGQGLFFSIPIYTAPHMTAGLRFSKPG
nr:hypothetical protein BaRGS_008836 [Batillaria attramentaria]